MKEKVRGVHNSFTFRNVCCIGVGSRKGKEELYFSLGAEIRKTVIGSNERVQNEKLTRMGFVLCGLFSKENE